MRILVAEPDESFAEAIGGQLRGEGHEVIVARDGIESVNAIRDTEPHAIVLSLELRWGGAEGVVEVLEHDDAFRRAKVITTGDSEESACVGHLKTPYSVDELRQLLERSPMSVPRKRSSYL